GHAKGPDRSVRGVLGRMGHRRPLPHRRRHRRRAVCVRVRRPDDRQARQGPHAVVTRRAYAALEGDRMRDKPPPADTLEDAATLTYDDGADGASSLLRELARTPEIFAGRLIPGSRLGDGRYTLQRLVG